MDFIRRKSPFGKKPDVFSRVPLRSQSQSQFSKKKTGQDTLDRSQSFTIGLPVYNIEADPLGTTALYVPTLSQASSGYLSVNGEVSSPADSNVSLFSEPKSDYGGSTSTVSGVSEVDSETLNIIYASRYYVLKRQSQVLEKCGLNSEDTTPTEHVPFAGYSPSLSSSGPSYSRRESSRSSSRGGSVSRHGSVRSDMSSRSQTSIRSSESSGSSRSSRSQSSVRSPNSVRSYSSSSSGSSSRRHGGSQRSGRRRSRHAKIPEEDPYYTPGRCSSFREDASVEVRVRQSPDFEDPITRTTPTQSSSFRRSKPCLTVLRDRDARSCDNLNEIETESKLNRKSRKQTKSVGNLVKADIPSVPENYEVSTLTRNAKSVGNLLSNEKANLPAESSRSTGDIVGDVHATGKKEHSYGIFKRGLFKFLGRKKSDPEKQASKPDSVKSKFDAFKSRNATLKKSHTMELDGISPRSRSDSLESNNNTLNSNSGTLKSNSGTLKSNSGTLKSNSDTLKSNSDTLKSKSDTLKSKSDSSKVKRNIIKSKSSTVLRDESKLDSCEKNVPLDRGRSELRDSRDFDRNDSLERAVATNDKTSTLTRATCGDHRSSREALDPNAPGGKIGALNAILRARERDASDHRDGDRSQAKRQAPPVPPHRARSKSTYEILNEMKAQNAVKYGDNYPDHQDIYENYVKVTPNSPYPPVPPHLQRNTLARDNRSLGHFASTIDTLNRDKAKSEESLLMHQCDIDDLPPPPPEFDDLINQEFNDVKSYDRPNHLDLDTKSKELKSILKKDPDSTQSVPLSPRELKTTLTEPFYAKNQQRKQTVRPKCPPPVPPHASTSTVCRPVAATSNSPAKTDPEAHARPNLADLGSQLRNVQLRNTNRPQDTSVPNDLKTQIQNHQLKPSNRSELPPKSDFQSQLQQATLRKTQGPNTATSHGAKINANDLQSQLQTAVLRKTQNEEPKTAVIRKTQNEEPKTAVIRKTQIEEPKTAVIRKTQNDEPKTAVLYKTQNEEPKTSSTTETSVGDFQSQMQNSLHRRKSSKEVPASVMEFISQGNNFQAQLQNAVLRKAQKEASPKPFPVPKPSANPNFGIQKLVTHKSAAREPEPEQSLQSQIQHVVLRSTNKNSTANRSSLKNSIVMDVSTLESCQAPQPAALVSQANPSQVSMVRQPRPKTNCHPLNQHRDEVAVHRPKTSHENRSSIFDTIADHSETLKRMVRSDRSYGNDDYYGRTDESRDRQTADNAYAMKRTSSDTESEFDFPLPPPPICRYDTVVEI